MKHHLQRTLSLFLVLCLLVTALAGVSAFAAENDPVLRVGVSEFLSCFSPFFAGTSEDQAVCTMTGVSLLETDRQGAVVEQGKTGETRAINGTDYDYSGIADLTVTENADGTVTYDFDLRDDVQFSDGTKLTADDVIFSMYVLSDPTYDGNSTFCALPIVGMEEYRAGMEPLYRLMLNVGRNNRDFSHWTKAEQTAFWSSLDKAGPAFAKSICDFCIAQGYNAKGDSVADCAASWGYELAPNATTADFWNYLLEVYENDIPTAVSVEAADVPWERLFPDFAKYTRGIEIASSADHITGIEKTGEYSLRVTLSSVDAAALYQLAITVAPMHYYGDAKQYDYSAHHFGFAKGDLTGVKAKNAKPLGAGPYRFTSYADGVVSFEANEHYFRGAPSISHVQFLAMGDQDKLDGVVNGTIDISEPGYARDTANAIRKVNGNKELIGDVITTMVSDNLGYGYLGISANVVNVGGKPGSEASKNLRKAFATVFANYRDETVETFYGTDTASVINYPISNTSWAAPQPVDEDYEIAFSRDVDGNAIYTPAMNSAAREQACLKAALGYFKAAGYTVSNGKVTAAPAGAKLRYEVWLPGEGTGAHPSYRMVTLAKNALAKIGIQLVVRDLANSADLWAGIEAEQTPMWCAAWGASADPDMYQIYYSGSQGGEPGGSNYMYDIADDALDKLVLQARQTTDQAARRQMYKQCLDIILDWAVEIPVYQRQNAVIFSTKRVDTATVPTDLTPYWSWLNEIHTLRMHDFKRSAFIDVRDGTYYADPVAWAVERKITTGTSAITFSPADTCTRAQVVTFLWRAAGSPKPKTAKNPFTDVRSGAYYEDAVLWAVEQGITNGTGKTTFGPGESCTRAQVVTFLWRAQGREKVGGSNPFRDVKSGEYYTDAVLWAVNHKPQITTGTSSNAFSPADTCTRAQVVTFLYRCMGPAK